MIQHIDLNQSIPADLNNARLDQALSRLFPDYSRAVHQTWIKNGWVQLNKAVCTTPKTKVHTDDQVHIQAQLENRGDWQAEDLPLNIVYEDEDLLIINKPVGLVVHPGAGQTEGTLINALLHHAPQLKKLPRAGIVHRLDKNTSGLLVVAKTLVTHHALVKALQKRLVKREYEAFVHGELISGGTVNAPIARHPRDRLKMSVQETGNSAITHYRLIKKYPKFTHIRVNLETGRTHQIRVHMQHLRHPIVGDTVYGFKNKTPLDKKINRQALHAKKLGLTHPTTQEWMEWECELPEDMQQLLL